MAQGFVNQSQKGYGTMQNLPNVEVASNFMVESNNLAESTTTNIYTIHSSRKSLEQAFRLIGTMRDNQGLRDSVHVTQLSCNRIVSQTTKDLQRLANITHRGNIHQKLQVDKLTNEFKEAVQFYGQIQKRVADQMKVKLLESNVPVKNDEEVLIQKQTQVERDALEFDQGMLIERERRVQQIEGDILDINQIMRELGAMIHEQGDVINSIENNIENVHGDVELGHQELIKAAQYQNKYRKKLCLLATICILIVAIIVTVILVKTLRK